MEELLEKALNGDKDAYVELMESIRIDMYKIARVRLRNIEDVNDAIHETILKSYKYLHQLQNKELFKSWIIKILINECNRIYNFNKSQKNIFYRLIGSNEYLSENPITLAEDDMDFNRFLEPLNYDEKMIMTLYYKSKFTTGEIADILDTNVNTIKSRFLRAKEKIKTEISKGGVKQYEKRK